ncbi:MAG: peptide chain release factor N(5)-glutamine methyltransferase, partial [Rubrivivax sp.]
MTAGPHTVAGLLAAARARIDPIDAEWLIAQALGRPRGWLYAHAADGVDATAAERFQALVDRREGGTPVAYLTGTQGFWTLDLAVNEATLVPRAETEALVALALARLPEGEPLRVADLGTGSGAIALAIAAERPLATVVATDSSKAALAVAVANAQRNGLDNVWFRRGDWCGALGAERFDLIASNPPYIDAKDSHLFQGDVRFEPASALVADNAGCKDSVSQTITTTQIPGVQLGGTGSTVYNGLPYFTQCTSLASEF